MCDDHQGFGVPRAGRPGMSRRGFLQASAGSAAALALLPGFARVPLRSPARAVTADGTFAYSMAMHIHSSFSEFNGSMDAHLAQAALNAVDVVWWTDHDWRMEGVNYRDVTHFTSFRETGASGQGGKWSWSKRESGPNTSASTGGIVAAPCSPNDPVSGGALHVAARSQHQASEVWLLRELRALGLEL